MNFDPILNGNRSRKREERKYPETNITIHYRTYEGYLTLKTSLSLLALFLILFPAHISAADLAAFRLKPLKDTVIILGAFSMQQGSDRIISRVVVPDPASLDRINIPAFDRFACKYYSPKMSRISDYTKNAVSGMMLLSSLYLMTDIRKENIQAFLTDMFMYSETELLITGLTQCSKGLFKRSRPYAYNTDVSLDVRKEKNASLSFWSGHASFAFASAVVTGYIFQKRHPGSRFVKPVWICGISCAAATGILRVRSGVHFPTDVLAGATVGAFTGWFITRVHSEKTQQLSLFTEVNGTHGIGISYSF